MREILRLADRATQMTVGLFTVDLPAADGRTRFDPSGLVKTWAARRAFALLMTIPGVDVCLNAGGDVALSPVTPDRCWRIGIEEPGTGGPLGVVAMTGGAMATSGTAARGGHIVDPRTGRAPSVLRQVSVLGPELLWADVLATAAFVAGDAALDLVAAYPGYEAVVVTSAGQARRTTGLPLQAPGLARGLEAAMVTDRDRVGPDALRGRARDASHRVLA
ncbi:FAD:protein FMN transferase [Serinicoccus chungangensis]|uniref:FAD:protein FMN transferase n=1 Tax=Serinicoccus chungangensis TaxID=767452 RepID=UPI00130527A1|nr:FAD:protein FMN transferase [Serinicoccus chungangensis]